MIGGEPSGMESESGKSRLTADENFANLPKVEVLNPDEENEKQKMKLQEEERLRQKQIDEENAAQRELEE